LASRRLRNTQLWQADVFKEPDLDQLISVTLVAKLEPVSSCHSVSHGLLLGLPLLSGKREPLTNDSLFITGVGDIPVSVRAMKAGAIDFLTKPVSTRQLLEAIGRATEIDAKGREVRIELATINDRLSTLTAREREVLAHVIAGRLNKQIAAALGIVEKTIKLHRGRMMQKMGVRTVADLVRIAERAGIRPQR
jgi:FixJ family two-component response regulator